MHRSAANSTLQQNQQIVRNRRAPWRTKAHAIPKPTDTRIDTRFSQSHRPSGCPRRTLGGVAIFRHSFPQQGFCCGVGVFPSVRRPTDGRDSPLAVDFVIFVLGACRHGPFLLGCKSVGFWVHRLTAKLLLLFGVLGNIVPVVQAAIPAPRHACCVRKAPHHCDESTNTDSSRSVIRGVNCCGHDCCRAVTTAQWAYPLLRGTSFSKQMPSAMVAERILDSPANDLLSSHASRAPPQFFIG